jgi:hypothetical protein
VARIRRHQDRERFYSEVEAAVEDALRETSERATGGRSAALDHHALRGIPMIGGAQGAIPGTVPHRQRRLDRWSGRR